MLKSKDSIYLQYQKGDDDMCGPENYEYRKGCSKTINIQKKNKLYTCCKYKTLDAINVHQFEPDTLYILAFNNLVVFGINDGGNYGKLVIIYIKYNKHIDSLVNGKKYRSKYIRAYIPITIENIKHLLTYLKNDNYSEILPRKEKDIIYPNTYDVIMIGEYESPVEWGYQTMRYDIQCPTFFTIGKTRIIENTEEGDEDCPRSVLPNGYCRRQGDCLLVPDYFGLYFNYLNNKKYFDKKGIFYTNDFFTIEVSGKDPIILKLFGNLLPNIKDTHILLDISSPTVYTFRETDGYSRSFDVIRVHIEKKRKCLKRKCLKGESMMYDTIWESSGEDSSLEPVLVVSGPQKYKMTVPQFKYSPNY